MCWLLVRRSTKEVITMFNWDIESNLVTYSEFTEAPSAISATTDVTVLAEISNVLLSDISSAVGYKQGTHQWQDLAYKVSQNNLNLYGELGYSLVKFAVDSQQINVSSKIQINATGFSGNYWRQYALATISKPMIGVYRYLVSHNNELKLFIFSQYSTTGAFETNGSGVGLLLSLSGKPLVKIEDGIVRSGINVGTKWVTSELVPMGFLTKDTNKLITS